MHVLVDLLKAGIRLSQLPALNIWSATLSDEVKRHLENQGFHFVDQTGIITRDFKRPTVLMKSLHKEITHSNPVLANFRLFDLGEWDLRMICSDNY